MSKLNKIPRKRFIAINNLLKSEIVNNQPNSYKRTISLFLSRRDTNFKLLFSYIERTEGLTLKDASNIKVFVVIYYIVLILFLLSILVAIRTGIIYIIPVYFLLAIVLYKLTTKFNVQRYLGYNISKDKKITMPKNNFVLPTPITIYNCKGHIRIVPYDSSIKAKKCYHYIVRKDGIYVALLDFHRGGKLSINNNRKAILYTVLDKFR